MNYFDSDSDESDTDDDLDLTYYANEISHSKFTIVLCELYNKTIHGNPLVGSNVQYHYLVTQRYKKLHMREINDMCEFVNFEYKFIQNPFHNIFPNYINIINNEHYIKPEIAECIYLSSGECVAIIKTFWIKIIQRNWKRICKERLNILKKRTTLDALKHREMTGKWPRYCLFYPSLRGMITF